MNLSMETMHPEDPTDPGPPLRCFIIGEKLQCPSSPRTHSEGRVAFLCSNRFLQANAIKRVIRMLKTDVNKGNETVVRDEASRSHTLIKKPSW